MISPMFICAAWKRHAVGPLHACRILVYRCDLVEGHKGFHYDQVLGVGWPDSDSELECRPRNIVSTQQKARDLC